MMIGEIGGEAEKEAADWLKNNNKRNLPVAGLIAGVRAPPRKKNGTCWSHSINGKRNMNYIYIQFLA